MTAPPGWNGGGFLAKLPDGAQQLVDQERERMGRLLTAVLVDQGVTLADLVFVILADLESEMGKAWAEVLMDLDEAREELRAAAEAGRRPVVLDVAVKDKAREFVGLLMPEVEDYVARRPLFAFVLMVIDQNDDPSITMACPTIHLADSGGCIH